MDGKWMEEMAMGREDKGEEGTVNKSGRDRSVTLQRKRSEEENGRQCAGLEGFIYTKCRRGKRIRKREEKDLW